MNAVWFWTLAAMFGAYAVLDGYDLGLGAVHLGLSRGAGDRRRQIAAIGPLWNGNEVWLIAAGGMMVVAFPRLYAAAFSGFYLALIVVLWLLILRGVAIEARGQISHDMWTFFWDVVFSVASLLLAALLGIALGNVVRGVPVGPDGLFQGSYALMLNPYALLTGLLSLLVLSWHGVNFMRTKAAGALLTRARRASRGFWIAVLAATCAATLSTIHLHPGVPGQFLAHPWMAIFPGALTAGLIWGFRATDRHGFAASTLVIAGLIGSAAATVYPNVLPSTLNPSYSLTIFNAANSAHGLRIAFLANAIAMAGVVAYRLYLHRVFRGVPAEDVHGYTPSGETKR